MDADSSRGLYGKYRIERIDGTTLPGGKHEHCQYFVLDLTHDKHALPALEAYALSCQDEYPLLAQDLMALARSNNGVQSDVARCECKFAVDVSDTTGEICPFCNLQRG